MDMKKLRRSGAKKTEAEIIFQQSRDYFFSNPQQQDDLMILKPMSGNRFGITNQPEKHPNLSISATNLKIKKAHATTLKDFFSAQKEQIVASYHPKKQKTSTAPLASASASRQKQDDRKPSELQLQKEKRRKITDIEEPNPMQFYQRNSTAIVRQILKMSESQLESDNTQDSKGFQQSQQQQYQFQEVLEINPAAVVRLPYGNIIRQSVSSKSEKKKKNVQFTETSEYSGKDFFLPSSTSEGTRRIYDQVKENKQKNEKYLLGRKNVHESLGVILPQPKALLPLPSSSKSSRPVTIAEKCREDIQHPRKFYCLSSVHFKNYKYPRPKLMPYEKESEKRTRMPLYLMPQSAPSREIEQICIGKYQSEVNEIQQSIEEKQQHSESMDEKYVLADLEATRQSYVSEIEYIQGRATATQQQQRKKFKTNAKYTFGDSKSKALNSINLRNSKMEDISDILFRTKSKIELQIARTKANVEKVQQEHSIYLQQTQLSMNTSVPQIYKNLVAQSDSLKQNQSPLVFGVPQEKYEIFQKNNDFQNEARNGEFHNNEGMIPVYEGHVQQQYGIEEENEEELVKSDQQHLTLNEQISAQEDYINKYILGAASQENQTNQHREQFQLKRNNSQEDHTQIKSLANFTSAQQLTDRDIIKKPQMGKLMVSVLIETFATLKLNRPALRNRILLALELNPHDDQEIISKQQFELFYTVLVSKTASLNTTIEFIVKFFKLDEEEDEEYQRDNNQAPLKKNHLKTDEFKRILRLLTISIDEKAKGEEKSLFDYMLENLSLTEVLRDVDNDVDLDQFKSVLMDGKINPKDIIDLICNLQ